MLAAGGDPEAMEFGEDFLQAAGLGADPGYTSSGVPTFESVREKIETRYETSVGAAELDAESAEGRAMEEQDQARQRAAAERLAQIRESMRDDTH